MLNTSNIKVFQPNELICQQGDEGHCAYIIESGLVEILLEKENGLVQHIGTRGAGSIIGEMALVDNKPRTATIKAIDQCQLLEITQDDFDNRLTQSDPVISMIMKVILARYRDMMTRAHIVGRPHDKSSPEALEKDFIEKANAVNELKLIQDLKNALINNEFILHYQPIMDAQQGKIVGFEALIRWDHPEKGLIYPDVFIQTAEESGLITDLSRWITKESCAFLSRIQKKYSHFNDLFISVNYSAKDFQIPDFKDYILKPLHDYDLEPQQFHIEITERLLMEQPSDARDILKECQDEGLVVSIDDFGTGYSSLSYLHYFPINILKIDRSFIVNMEKDKSSFKLVESIISLGHNIGMSIIAEGIEEENQATTLKNMGCDKIQGYFFSKPLAENDLISYLSENNH